MILRVTCKTNCNTFCKEIPFHSKQCEQKFKPDWSFQSKSDVELYSLTTDKAPWTLKMNQDLFSNLNLSVDIREGDQEIENYFV